MHPVNLSYYNVIQLMKSAEASFSMSYAQRRKIRHALEDSSLYNAVLEELLSGIDGDCAFLFSRSIQRAGIETEQPSLRAHVSFTMSDLAQSARFCDSNGFKLTRMITALFNMNACMSAVLERVLQRMVRAVVRFRQMCWGRIGAAAAEMIKNLMKRVNDWWTNDMRRFYNRGEPRPCISQFEHCCYCGSMLRQFCQQFCLLPWGFCGIRRGACSCVFASGLWQRSLSALAMPPASRVSGRCPLPFHSAQAAEAPLV
jgi:hypothetical protein